jgi:DNA repair protein RecO (recombination protein O)
VKSLKGQGIVIKQTPYGEADKIITIFTSGYGKLRFKAPGIRRLYSRKAGNLEMFNYVSFSAFSGKQLDIITEVKLINSFPSLKRNLMKVGVSYHYCELIDRLVSDRVEHYDIYDQIKDALISLESSSESIETLGQSVKAFEIKLLSSLGFGLPDTLTQRNLVQHIEQIIEKPLKSRKILNSLNT